MEKQCLLSEDESIPDYSLGNWKSRRAPISFPVSELAGRRK
jgi:hypothetical protein